MCLTHSFELISLTNKTFYLLSCFYFPLGFAAFFLFPPHSSCWSHCCPRWWHTRKTLREAKGGHTVGVHQTPQRGRISDCVTCFQKRTHWSKQRYQASAPKTNLHDVPEEVYRRLGSQGHHWGLSSGGEGSAWTEEDGKLPGTGFQLVKGEPQEEEHRQCTESNWWGGSQTGTSEQWPCKTWVR